MFFWEADILKDRVKFRDFKHSSTIKAVAKGDKGKNQPAFDVILKIRQALKKDEFHDEVTEKVTYELNVPFDEWRKAVADQKQQKSEQV